MYDKNLYKETFSEVKASREILVEVMKMTVNNKRKTFQMSRVAIVAVTIILILGSAGAAFAYVGFTQYENPLAMLKAFFGNNGDTASELGIKSESEGVVEYDEDGQLSMNLPGWTRIPVDESLASELIAGYISAEAATLSYGGYKLSVEANLYDTLTGSGLLYYTFENPAGISGYEVMPNGEVWFNSEKMPVYPCVWGKGYIDEAMSTDEKLYICQYYTELAVIDGALEIQLFPVDDPDRTVIEKLPVTNNGMATGLSLEKGKLRVSPISIKFNLPEFGYNAGGPGPGFICLWYKDGSEYVLEDEGAFISNQTYASISDDGNMTIMFNRIVDTRSLSEIVLADVVIPIG